MLHPTTSRPFRRSDLEKAARTLLRAGRWANARVERVQLGGRDWVVKDFSGRSWLVRNTVGRFLLGRELSALRHVQGIAGVQQDAFRIDAHAIALRYLPGETLDRVAAEKITPAFLERLERLIGEVHARGIVHLDVRGSGNLLMTPDGQPGIIDFQAYLPTR